MQDVRPGRARSVLIGAQVLASTLLLICSAVFLRGALAAARVEPGVRVSDTVVVTLANESRRPAVLAALSTDPVVSMVSASSPRDGRFATVRATDTGVVAPYAYQLVSSDYFAVMGIDVARGRAFSADERSVESGTAIVSARLADRMWPGGDALGRAIRVSLPSLAGVSAAGERAQAAQRTFTIIGVAHQRPENYAFSDGAPDLYLPAEPTSAGTQLMLRVREDPLRARALLLDRLTAVDPALGNVRTMQSIFRGLETILRIASIVTVLLGGLALLLTASGLFSVLSYVVQQRTREIGVRMALGASARTVARMVVLESARPVGLGLAGGVLLAGGLSGALMASPAASQVGGMVQVLDPISYIFSLAVIAVACVISAAVPAWRAARVNPMTTLRKD
jgi:hypothetical protein